MKKQSSDIILVDLNDYEEAITEETGVLMKVHTSNYKILGFTESVDISDLKKYNTYKIGGNCRYVIKVHDVDNLINFWKNNYPDVITGWNIDRFDIKYNDTPLIINEILNFLKFSPLFL